MQRKPMDMHDAEAIASRTAFEFTSCVKRQLWLAGHIPMDGDKLAQISEEIEQTVILLLEPHVRECEPIRDREALAPVTETPSEEVRN